MGAACRLVAAHDTQNTLFVITYPHWYCRYQADWHPCYLNQWAQPQQLKRVGGTRYFRCNEGNITLLNS
jgi:hypothetical protein